MRALVLCLMLVPACWSTTDATPADPQEVAASLPEIVEPVRHAARGATALRDFVPPTFLDAPAAFVGDPTEARVEATYAPPGRALRLVITKMDDVAATRARFELLGKEVAAHMDGAEVRGLRFQGNPAQVRRALSGDGAGTLSIVATNTYLVELHMTPTASTEELIRAAERLDIGSMTLYAIERFKAERATPPE